MTVRFFQWRLIAAMLAIFFLAGMIGGPGTMIDESISQAAGGWRAISPGFTAFAASFTELGGARVTLGLTLLAALSLIARRKFGLALILLVTVLAERELVEWLKELTARSRPLFGSIHPTSMAFPSGHSANSMTAFLAIALLAVPASYRRPAAIAGLILSFMVGLSRIYLGVHWPSDVIGGWALGLIATGMAVALAERSGALRFEAQHEIVGRHSLPPGKDQPS
ncbi:MAG: phosphatase PAP2 family protein [Sphingomicrobium sp.]